jgi:ubiquinone/menaquinone biosynthesis C-methylase UbiE
LGCDVSETMAGLAQRRLAGYAGRATIIRSDGTVRFPLPDRSVDRVICAYVLDLLSDEDIKRAFDEAYRVLAPGGRFCITCLTNGVTLPSRALSSLWAALFRVRPTWVGGCRPISLLPFADKSRWQLEHQRVLTPFGIPSEVLVLDAKVLLAAV